MHFFSKFASSTTIRLFSLKLLWKCFSFFIHIEKLSENGIRFCLENIVTDSVVFLNINNSRVLLCIIQLFHLLNHINWANQMKLHIQLHCITLNVLFNYEIKTVYSWF